MYLIKAIKENTISLPIQPILFLTMKKLVSVAILIFHQRWWNTSHDMGAIGDGQTTDEYSVSICAMDASVHIITTCAKD